LAATLAQIFNPTFIAINPSGDIVFCDSGNAVLRKVSSTGGVISTIAGNFSLGAGFSGDGGAATAARIGSNCTFCFDAAGNMFISDGDNHCIRKVSSAGGMITTIAGTPGVPGFAGDGGMADTAMFNHPAGIAIDASGNLYVADAGNNVLRKVSSTGGVITTIAGTPMVAGFSGDGAAATAAKLHHPYGVAVTSSGSEIFLADQANSRMRYISSTGSIFTVVGTAIAGFNGDGACATTEIDSPQGVCIDTLHNCYIADRNNNRIRYIDYHLEVYRVSEQSVVDLYPNPSDGHIR
jgi:DNA-binding beta-propeller fold protein YncE